MRKRVILLAGIGLCGGVVAATRRYALAAEDARAELTNAGFGPVVPLRVSPVRGGLRFVASVVTGRHAVELVRVNGEWFPVSCTALATNEPLTLNDTTRNTRVTSQKQLESLMPAYSEQI